MKYEELSKILREEGHYICPICGMPFKPYRKTQKTCGDPECQKVAHSQKTQETMKRKMADPEERAKRNDTVKRYRQKQKAKPKDGEWIDRLEEYVAKYEDKCSYVSGIDYGKRQMEKTLAGLSKIDTDMTHGHNDN